MGVKASLLFMLLIGGSLWLGLRGFAGSMFSANWDVLVPPPEKPEPVLPEILPPEPALPPMVQGRSRTGSVPLYRERRYAPVRAAPARSAPSRAKPAAKKAPAPAQPVFRQVRRLRAIGRPGAFDGGANQGGEEGGSQQSGAEQPASQDNEPALRRPAGPQRPAPQPEYDPAEEPSQAPAGPEPQPARRAVQTRGARGAAPLYPSGPEPEPSDADPEN